MSNYKAGFEIPGDDSEIKDKNAEGSREEYRKGFVIEDDNISGVEIKAKDVDNEDLLSDFPDDDTRDDIESLRYRFFTSPIFMLFILIIVIGALQVYELISSAFDKSTLAGTVFSSGIVFALCLVIFSLLRELRAVWKLKSTYKYRVMHENILKNGTNKDALLLCQKMTRMSDAPEKVRYDSFRGMVKQNFSVEEVFNLYEREVLSPLDKKAREVVIRRSRETGIVVALSPIAWLDMAFSLARSLRMVREIAEVYGYRCGLWGRFELYRKIISNVVFIGVADLTTDALTDVIGAKTFASLSVAAGQGIAAGIYSTRLGYMTIKAVRPLPLARDTLSLASLRRDMITGTLKFLTTKGK